MPRKPFVLHVLTRTREIYNLTREKLASRIGAAPITIKKIESGDLKVSATLARRIYIQTGLNPVQLIENLWPETPMHPGGEPLTSDHMKRVQEKRTESEGQDDVDRSVRHFTAVLESLLDASVVEHKLWALRPTIQAALDKVIDDFELRDAFEQLLHARWEVKEPWTILEIRPEKKKPWPIRQPLSLYVQVNSDKAREKAAAKRKEFFRDRKAAQEILKAPVRQKTPRSATRKRPTA
jgi:DNA-binding XRE family transcriptional regulator